MTLSEVCSQLYNLSIDGFFNRTKFTKRQFVGKITSDMNARSECSKRLVYEIALPDGWWPFSITKYGDRADSFDYFIPSTKEQSNELYNSLLKAAP